MRLTLGRRWVNLLPVAQRTNAFTNYCKETGLRHRVSPCRSFVKALVRWATGERLTNRLPKLSLITLSPPLNSGILGLRMGLYVPNPMFFYNLWGPRESDSSDS